MDNMNYKLIKATKNNKEELIKYKLASILDYADTLSEEEKKRIINYVNENIPKQIENYQMISIDDKVIGCLLITNNEDGTLLDELYIHPEFQNRGIGTNIIKDLMRREYNIYLWVYKNNVKAFNLYQKLGFNIIEETENRYYMKYEGE